MCWALILPKVVEAVGAQLSVFYSVHDVAMPQEVLQRSGIDAISGEFEAAGVAEHVRMNGKGKFSQSPVRRTILRSQALVTGPPRSVLKTKRIVTAAMDAVESLMGRWPIPTTVSERQQARLNKALYDWRAAFISDAS